MTEMLQSVTVTTTWQTGPSQRVLSSFGGVVDAQPARASVNATAVRTMVAFIEPPVVVGYVRFKIPGAPIAPGNGLPVIATLDRRRIDVSGIFMARGAISH